MFRALELGRYVYCLQEFVPHGREDIRAFVVGERVIGAMLRRGQGWKTNASQGARGEPLELDERLVDLSVRAAGSWAPSTPASTSSRAKTAGTA